MLAIAHSGRGKHKGLVWVECSGCGLGFWVRRDWFAAVRRCIWCFHEVTS